MFIRQLHYLIALAEHRHFAQAAEHCCVSQPSLSTAIRQLEQELGITIIQRDHHFQGFTPEGGRVLAWARQTLASLDGLRQEAALAQTVAGGVLAIGAIPSAMRVVSLLINEYRREIPRLSLKVFALSTHDILGRLKKHELHVGIAYTEQCPADIYEALPLFSERFVLLTGVGATLPDNKVLSWAEVGQFPLCLFNHEMHNRRIIEYAFQQAGVSPTVVVETNALDVLYEMVSRGRVCSIAPISAVPACFFTHGIGIHPIMPQPAPEISLLRLRQENQPALLCSIWAMTPQCHLQQALDQAITRHAR
ncbi:Transcriptional regulator [Sodalis praecaptivus]|uniref:Transcriptional regulator n=1 Tax=Sodalis praecaptivus TaxID=1239307 RepID=W0HNA5_9GAMM|nr:LysR family transcriptional regulator [Sodalis praecaptivus]AHF75314.1 Transcriptional regulator [Sodalis praecaptivus]